MKKESGNKKSKMTPKNQYIIKILTKFFDLPMKNQILGFAIIFYFIITLVIIQRRKITLDSFKEDITNNVYISTGTEYFYGISEMYRNIHSVSLKRNLTNLTKGMNFLSLLTIEMNRINSTSTFSDENTKNYINENSLTKLKFKIINPKLSYDLNENFNFDNLNKEKFFKDNSFLFPIYYSLIPNLIDDASFNNFQLERVYFVDSKFKNNTCEGFTNYFSFPKYDKKFKNFYLMDEKVDPHSNCEKDSIFKNFTNFFQNYEENFAKNSKFSRKLINQIQRKENDMTYKNFFAIIQSTKTINNIERSDIISIGFNFINNLSKINNKNNFLSHFSIAYLENNMLENYTNTIKYPIRNEKSPDLPSYDIINGKRIVLTIPPFLENIYKFGYNKSIYFKQYVDDFGAIVNPEDLFAYGENSTILKTEFQTDAKNFNLIGFLGKQILTTPNYTCSNIDYDIKDFGILSIEECLKDMCLFNDCIGTESIFESNVFQKNLIKCECIPYFCGKYLIKTINQVNESYTKYLKDDNLTYNKDLTNNYSNKIKLNETINKYDLQTDFFKFLGNYTLDCEITLDKKKKLSTQNGISFDKSMFRLNMMKSKLPFDGVLLANYMIDLNYFFYELYLNFLNLIDTRNFYLMLIHSILLIFASSFIFLNKFRKKINDFEKRIDELNEFHILKAINDKNEEMSRKNKKKFPGIFF